MIQSLFIVRCEQPSVELIEQFLNNIYCLKTSNMRSRSNILFMPSVKYIVYLFSLIPDPSNHNTDKNRQIDINTCIIKYSIFLCFMQVVLNTQFYAKKMHKFSSLFKFFILFFLSRICINKNRIYIVCDAY